MESGITSERKTAIAETAEPQNLATTESEDSFQSLIYGLFEKNGIINDVRAYLRGHIIEVLKGAQTGDPPQCHKRFTQRLELTYQALNMLIAEYLMRLEFNYSLSVFVSEIPLANMVFGFAKTLMERIGDNKEDLRFKDPDVWSILNYLGVQCDSQHASNVVQMYNNEKQHPLLLCILKCMPMYKDCRDSPDCVSLESVVSSKSLNSSENDAPQKKPECKHYYYCKICQNRLYRLKSKYKKKQKYFAKNVKTKESNSLSSIKSDSFVKNINSMEKDLIEKVFKNMFQQLKTVYETEIEMVKVEEEKKVKRSMATHEMQLQKKQDELEETFKAREEELQRSVQHKKQFLWGLARSLRDQHLHMTRAMHDVRAETERLEVKEDSLKTQLAEAEKILKKRGEEMRLQISNELAILEGHLASMKRERENITFERSELENLKNFEATNSKVNKEYNVQCEEIHSHYNLLKNELAILKMYVETSQLQAKCVIERGIVTESMEFDSNSNVQLNNAQGNEKCSKSDDFDGRIKGNQVVNNFRKKNVNFSQSNLDEIYRERSRDRSRSSNSSEAGDTATPALELERGRDRDLIQRLRDENDRLKANARRHWAQLPAQPRAASTLRPRTAPPALPHHAPHDAPHHAPHHAPHDVPVQVPMCNLNATASANTMNVGWRKGAGEELSMFSNAQPRILVPGDTLPFIGVLRDRHGNARRPMTAAQARAGRGRACSLGGVSKHPAAPLRDRHVLGSNGQGVRVNGPHFPIASSSLQTDEETYQSLRDRLQQRPRPAQSLQINRGGEKSPRTMLREAKDKLRSKDISNDSPALPRNKSPTTVLREAKMRLRKLEIEAEAVEKSYFDFRRRQSELPVQRSPRCTQDNLARALDVTRSHSKQELDDTTRNDIEAQFADLHKSMRGDFDKYIREYKSKFEIAETYFRNKPTAADRVKPIPATYVTECKDHVDVHGSYLETPLVEFRKLYSSTRQTRRDVENISSTRDVLSDGTSDLSKNDFEFEPSVRNDTLRKIRRKKEAELQVLKQNINNMYHITNDNCDSVAIVDQQANQSYQPQADNENKLRVEVEEMSEIKDMKTAAQDLVVVVHSAVNSREVSGQPSEMFSAQMTIIVSPKRGEPAGTESAPAPRSLSPEQAARLTRNDVLDAIFHAKPDNNVSSVQMQLELKDEDSISEYEKGEYEYSPEIDSNYNSRVEYTSSPISMAKLPEDDNFWKS